MKNKCNNINFCYSEVLNSQIYKFEKFINQKTVLWEKHLLDCSKSIINPLYQYQGVYNIDIKNEEITKKNEKSKLKYLNSVQKVCLPKDWFLCGEEIIDIKLNNNECIYCKCPQKFNRLVIDLNNLKLKSGDIINLIAITQHTLEFRSDLLKMFLELKFNVENIKFDYYYLEKKVFTSGILFPKYKSFLITTSEPFEKILNLDYWLKIPDLFEFEINEFYMVDKKDYSYIEDKFVLEFLNIVKKRKLMKCIINYSEIKESFKKIRKKRKELKNKIEQNKEKIKKSTEIKSALYQFTQENTRNYNFKQKELDRYLIWESEIKFNFMIKMWFWIPLIIACIPTFIAFNFLISYWFGMSLINFSVLNFNTWLLFTISLTISTWILLALNWDPLKRLQLFQQKVYKIYFIILLISIFSSLFLITIFV